MQAKLSELAELAGTYYQGDGNCLIHAVNTLSSAGEGEIAFLANEKYRHDLHQTQATAVILQPTMVEECPVSNLIISDNPYLTYALVAQFLNQEKNQTKAGISSSAVIDGTAQISDSASIGPLVVIGCNVKIGDGVVIGAGSIIGDNCVINDESILAARVTLYADVIVGKRCLLHSGSVIGSDGFGFANHQGRWVKIPQNGSVILGDDVEVGANTTIDRGAIHNTMIENGVKLDNLIQIAHNVTVGKNTAIAAGTAIAGSTRIGQGCTIGGCSGIVGHISIGDGVHISGMTMVTKSISKPGQYTGNVPAMSHKLWAKNMVRLKQLDELNKKIKILENRLNELE